MFENERLKIIRKKLGYKSREKFANRLNIPFTTLRAYEQGTIENIPHSFLLMLLDNFDVNINWLMTGKGEMFIKPTTSNTQTVTNNSGINALNNHGEQNQQDTNVLNFDKDILQILKTVSTVIKSENKESFKKHLKSWIVENI